MSCDFKTVYHENDSITGNPRPGDIPAEIIPRENVKTGIAPYS